ncbi:MAG: hypothetical protein AB1758_05340 [Candidatus Eremiobacterota bacterium]
MSWKTLTLWLNLAAFFSLVVGLAAVFWWPDQLALAGLNRREGSVLLLQLVSFLLLSGSFQRQLETSWRRACLAGSFLVLSQASLLAWMPLYLP